MLEGGHAKTLIIYEWLIDNNHLFICMIGVPSILFLVPPSCLWPWACVFMKPCDVDEHLSLMVLADCLYQQEGIPCQ